MKYFVFIFFGIITSFQLLAIDPVGKIAKANAAKERAEEALRNGDFEKVVEHYTYLLDSLGYESPEAEINRAHAYFQLKDTVNAFDAYRRVSDVNNDQLKSKAMLQMGNLSEMQKEYESALSFFKEALKADPTNNKARYNYELLIKKMKEQEKQNQDQDQNQDQNQDNKDQQEQDQENKDQQNKENKDSENQQKDENQEKSQEDKESEEQQQKDDAEQQDGEQSEQDKGKEQKEQKQQEQKEGEEKKEGEEQEMKPSTKQKLEEMNISEEKAQMILEALKNKESQYFQQLRKKATKKQDSGKPDW